MSFSTSRSASLSAPSTKTVGLPISPSPHVRAALSSPPSPIFSSSPLAGRRPLPKERSSACGPSQCSRCLSRPQRSHKKQKIHVPVPVAKPRPASSIFRLGQRLKDEIRGRFRVVAAEPEPVKSTTPSRRSSTPKKSSSSSSSSKRTPSPQSSRKPAMLKIPVQPEIVPDHWAEY